MTFGHLNSLFLFIETPTQLYGPVTYAVAKELHSAVVVLKFLWILFLNLGFACETWWDMDHVHEKRRYMQYIHLYIVFLSTEFQLTHGIWESSDTQSK